MQRRSLILGSLAAALPLAACAPPTLAPREGSGVRLTHLKSWPAVQGQVMLAMTGLKAIPVRHSVAAWRMTYRSPDAAGRQIELSGLLALPRNPSPRTLVSWHHGTSTSRNEVPSTLS